MVSPKPSEPLEGALFERERALLALPNPIQEKVRSILTHFTTEKGKEQLEKHCASTSTKKLKSAASFPLKYIKGEILLSVTDEYRPEGDDPQGSEEVTNASVTHSEEEKRQIAHGLVFIGMCTPVKEPDNAIGPFPMQSELYVIVHPEIVSAWCDTPINSVWDLKLGAIQAGLLKRKPSGIFAALRSKKTYVMINERRKEIAFFESDLSLKPISILDLSTATVEFDSHHSIKVYNNQDTEILHLHSKSSAEEWLNACINAGAQYREAFTKSIDQITSFYELSDFDMKGNEVSMRSYQGKVLVIVNVSSKCGLTPTNYPELVSLDLKYRDQGLQILAFPCNQFANQEPGTHEEIMEFVKQYNCEFPFFEKADVNGSNARPVFAYLKAKLPGAFGNFVKWNFTKFLVDRNGKPYKRFAPKDLPMTMEEDIKMLLAQEAQEVMEGATVGVGAIAEGVQEVKSNVETVENKGPAIVESMKVATIEDKEQAPIESKKDIVVEDNEQTTTESKEDIVVGDKEAAATETDTVNTVA